MKRHLRVTGGERSWGTKEKWKKTLSSRHYHQGIYKVWKFDSGIQIHVPGIVDKRLSGNVWYHTITGYVDGICSFYITRKCNKLLYQELLTKNCLGNVWYRSMAASFEGFCSFDITRHSWSCFCDLDLETSPFAKNSFWQQTLCPQCPGHWLLRVDMSTQHVALDEVKWLHRGSSCSWYPHIQVNPADVSTPVERVRHEECLNLKKGIWPRPQRTLNLIMLTVGVSNGVHRLKNPKRNSNLTVVMSRNNTVESANL